MKTYQHFIGGQYVDPIGGQWIDSMDPYRGEAWVRSEEHTSELQSPLIIS